MIFHPSCTHTRAASPKILHGEGHLWQLDPSSSPRVTGLPQDSLWACGFCAFERTRIRCGDAVQCIPRALKTLWALSSSLSCLPGKHWPFHHLPSLAFSRMSWSCWRAVCGFLSRLDALQKGSCLSFHGLTVPFSSVLKEGFMLLPTA